MAAATTIPCKQCGYANEPERIYCHNCGAKLDRSLLPKDTGKPAKESVEKTRRRVVKMTSPARGFFLHWQRLLPETILMAVIAAGAIQAARPPAGIPAMPTHDQMLEVQPLAEQIEDLQGRGGAQQFSLSEPAINLYLYKTIQAGTAAAGDYLKFDRAFVNLGLTKETADICRVTAQESAFGYPLYACGWYRLSVSGNKLLATNVGGNLGRLPIHPLVMEYTEFALHHLWDALQRERRIMDGMQGVAVLPGQIILVTRPGSAPH